MTTDKSMLANREWHFPVMGKEIHDVVLNFYKPKSAKQARKLFEKYIQYLVNSKIEEILVRGIE